MHYTLCITHYALHIMHYTLCITHYILRIEDFSFDALTKKIHTNGSFTGK